MGGGQSVPTDNVSYECNEHVAAFIKTRPEYLNELKLSIQNHATFQDVTTNAGVGKVKLQPLQNEVTVTSTDECKRKLDEYFQKFMSYEETMQLFPQFSSIAHGTNLRCTVQQNQFQNTVRITGVSTDVKTMIRRLREAQNPQLSHPAQTTASSSMTSSTSMSSRSYSTTSQATSHVATISFATPSYLTDMSASGDFSLKASNSDNATSLNMKYVQQKGKVESGKRSKNVQHYTPDAPVATRSRSPSPLPYLSTNHLYTLPASDPSAARFIKFSSTHTLLLKEAMESLADVIVWMTKPDRKMEYRCHPKHILRITAQDFDSSCESMLKEFLKNYTSKMRRFNHDHLMKVVAKAPDFFEQLIQQDNDTVYVKWFIEENKVLISGQLNSAEEKEKEIVNFLNTTVPRTLKNAYAFEIEPPDVVVARFIRQSKNHMDLFQEAVGDDARVSIALRNFSIHFKALIELTPIELPNFEAKHTKAVASFFEKYLSWRYAYSRGAVTHASRNNQEFFDVEDEDVKLVINDGLEVVLVGLKQNVSLKRAKLFQIMKQHWNPNKSTPKKGRAPSRHREENPPRRGNERKSSSTSDAATSDCWEPQPFVYQPRAQMCRDVIKHVLQSPVDRLALKHSVGHFVEYEVFPNQMEPLGVKFYARHDAQVEREYFELQMPRNVHEFFEKFLVTTKPINRPHEFNKVASIVEQVGHKFEVPPNMLSMHRKPGLFVIVGVREIILEVSKAINGNVVEHPPRPLMLPLSARPRDDQKGFHGGVRQRSRRDSEESNSSISQDPAEPGNKNSKQRRQRNKKEKKKPVLPASTRDENNEGEDANAMGLSPKKRNSEGPLQKKFLDVHYTPKKSYESLFNTVISTSNLYNELKVSCADFCTIQNAPSFLKVTSVEQEAVESRQKFSQKVVKHIESFLDKLEKVVIPLDQHLMLFFNEHKEQWLATYYKEDDGVVLQVKAEGLEISGVPHGVEKYKKIVEGQLEFSIEERECGMDVCRVLVACGVLDEVNKTLAGKTEVSCSVDEGKVFFRGPSCFVDYAIGQLAEKGNLIEEQPVLSGEKLLILTKFLLPRDKEEASESYINTKLVENNVKGVLMVREGLMILTTMTRKAFDDCCKIIDDLVQMRSLSLPEAFQASFVESEEWKLLMSAITGTKRIICEVQEKSVELVGIDGSNNIEEASMKIEDYLKKSSIQTRPLTCAAHVGRFIVKFLAGTDAIPQNVSIKEFATGIYITGPAADVHTVVNYLRGIEWHRTKLSYSVPNLDSYFSSDAWEGVVKYLENAVRCTVSYEVGKAQESLEEMEIPPSSSQSYCPQFGSDENKTASYGSVNVSVCNGDITREDSDIIINGVTRDFDLSRGTVSPALLKKAGPKMQEQCNSDPVMSSSVIRVTRGWNLLCDYVIHLVTPHTGDKLKTCIKDALDHAEMLKASSVAMPTLGAGGVGLNADAVASAMSEAFELFVSEKPQFVKTIKVVVYDRAIMDIFQSSVITSKEIMGFGKREALAAEKKAKLSVLSDKVAIMVNAQDETSLVEAKRKIEACVSEKITTKTVKDDFFIELDDHDCIDIYQAAVKHNVVVTVNDAESEILLHGMIENVRQLYDFVRELFFELREAMTMSKLVTWKWAGSSKQFTALPLRVSRAIEREFEKSKRGVHHIEMYGTILEVNFTTMFYEFNHVTGQLKRVDSVTEQIPSDWSDMMGKTWMKATLSPDSSEYKRVVRLFTSSRPTYNGISSIERIQHPSLYKQYLIKKNDVERHMLSNNPVERELFHGTSQDDADKICAEGFDRNFAGKNATVYGKGSYFAVNSTYSVNYATKSASSSHYLFLARVLTGDFCKGHHDFKAPPKKLHSGDIVRLYDSVVDAETNPSIFVVFKDSSVYPYYLITFY